MDNANINNNWKVENGIILDNEDNQHIAELCDGATQEQGDLIVQAVNALPYFVGVLKTLQKDCTMALDRTWDKSDEGFEDMLTVIEDMLAKVAQSNSK